MSAVISECGKYRYHLQRVWDASLPRVCWVMLNPSTADAEKDDATIRRCIGYSKAWGYGGLDVVNLFAYRATDPKDLKRAGYPTGPENAAWLQRITSAAPLVMAAWGRNGHIPLLDCDLHVLGDAGWPRHPLRLSKELKPVLWRFATASSPSRTSTEC